MSTGQLLGAIINIRDLAPVVAGLVAGPYVGLAVGLIGGIHRFFLGRDLHSVFANICFVGLFSVLICFLNKGRLSGVIQAMLFASAIELLNPGFTLLMVHPYNESIYAVLTSTTQMIIANLLGMGISIIIIHNTKEKESGNQFPYNTSRACCIIIQETISKPKASRLNG